MKITWNENPLDTKIELDDVDRKLLRARLQVESYKELLFDIEYALKGEDGPYKSMVLQERVQDALDRIAEYEKSTNASIEEAAIDYEKELQGTHVGDCTCVPCSCSKCFAEEILEINTIAGLGKHSAYKVDSAVRKSGSISGAIEQLQNYDPAYDPKSNFDKATWDLHVPRWKKEAEHALNWLIAYREEHFGER